MELITKNKTLPSQIVITGQIADASGHTDFAGTLDEAMEVIMDQVKNAGKWVVVNGNPYIFNNFDTVEENELRDMLMNDVAPSFVLHGKLQGGAAGAAKTVYRTRVTSQPLSKVLNSKNRPQLAVVMKSDHGKTYCDIIVSNYGGARKRLRKHFDYLLDGIDTVLNGELR